MTNTDYCALNARAVAPLFWPAVGFSDRAASRLVTLLNIDGEQRFNPQLERAYLQASRWLDTQCMDFFAQHPKALAIELGAGLSTRFHRLSEQHEWPQFSWVDIDRSDIIRAKTTAMPQIDNYHLLASEQAANELLAHSGWQGTQPLVVIIDSLLQPDSDANWRDLLDALLTARAATTPVLLLIAHSSKTYSRFSRGWQWLAHLLLGSRSAPSVFQWPLWVQGHTGKVVRQSLWHGKKPVECLSAVFPSRHL